MQSGPLDVQAFYDEPLGQIARRAIFRRVRLAWPELGGTRILGYGYALPYLKALSLAAERAVAFVPAQFGTPDTGFGLSSQGEEGALPFADSVFDRILIVHGLECAEAARPLLRQIWRVLAPGGRVLSVVPNRASLWSQIERSPFAQGRPFSKGQLERLMRESMFAPERWDTALYFPPLRSRRLVRTGIAWDRLGRSCWPRLAGVHLLDATKSMYAILPAEKSRQRLRVFARAGQ
ncbi:MAG TPA: class I SAM-dependent methyltransferase [Rhizomicrobium sp.]|jgi:SAM-dependent methyltransferase